MSALALIVTSYILFKDYLEYDENKKLNENLISEVITSDSMNETIYINWKKLKQINNDIIGWIEIKNTNINYPILKDNEELKYLKTSYNGTKNKNGSIFTINDNPFAENVTTIYGHNMKNGTMFSVLRNYLDEDFLNSHKQFNIYTENQNYIATIFSCYTTNIYEETNNLKNLSFNEEIKYYKAKSKYNIDVEDIEKVVKLSTCSYINNQTNPTSERYFIIAKLEKTN